MPGSWDSRTVRVDMCTISSDIAQCNFLHVKQTRSAHRWSLRSYSLVQLQNLFDTLIQALIIVLRSDKLVADHSSACKVVERTTASAST